MESVFRICNCVEEYKVKYSTCTLLEGALTWWNSYAQTVGIDAAYRLPWEDLKTMMRDEYCPREELQQLEVELWNHTIKDNDIITYTTRFHQLALLCPSMVDPEAKRIERYIWGLPEQIQGMVTASKPGTIQSAVRMAHNLMAQVVRRGTHATGSNKRKGDGTPDNTNTGSQQVQRSGATKTYSVGLGEKRYKGNKPFCSECNSHHKGPCGTPCNRCKSYGHQTGDCRVPTTISNPNAPRTCFECGSPGHFKRDCPKFYYNA